MKSILAKYSNYTNIFLKDFIIRLSEYSEIIKCIINLVEDKQLLYRLIFSLKPINLKTLKKIY